MIVTISREFGSGGREIGRKLAEALDIAYYDDKIITLLSEATGLDKDYIEKISEQKICHFPMQHAKSFYTCNPLQHSQTELLVKQSNIIKAIADKIDCVIVGRGANVILREYDTIDLFVYSDMQSKINRCIKKAEKSEKLTEKEIKRKINQINKNRVKFHNLLSSEEWGKKENYDLCINTTEMEIDDIIPSLKIYVEKRFKTKI